MELEAERSYRFTIDALLIIGVLPVAVPVKRHPLSEREKCLLLMVICLALLLVASRFLFVPTEGAATLRAEQEQLLGEQSGCRRCSGRQSGSGRSTRSLQPEEGLPHAGHPFPGGAAAGLGRFEGCCMDFRSPLKRCRSASWKRRTAAPHCRSAQHHRRRKGGHAVAGKGGAVRALAADRSPGLEQG